MAGRDSMNLLSRGQIPEAKSIVVIERNRNRRAIGRIGNGFESDRWSRVEFVDPPSLLPDARI